MTFEPLVRAALLVLSALLAGAHPDSESSSVLRVERCAVTWRHTVQVASLTEALPGVDANFDGELSVAELAQSHAEIESYFNEHWRVELNGWPVSDFSTDFLPSNEPGLFRALRRAKHRRPVRRLTVRVDPFMEKDPWHRSLVDVHCGDDLPQPLAFGAGVTVGEVDCPEQPLFAGVRAGMGVLSLGLAGVVGLLMCACSKRMSALCFLCGAALGAAIRHFGLSAPEPFTALLVSGTVVLVGVEALVAHELPRRRTLTLVLGALGAWSVSSTFDPQTVAGGEERLALLSYLAGWGLAVLLLSLLLLRYFRWRSEHKLIAAATITAGVCSLWSLLR